MTPTMQFCKLLIHCQLVILSFSMRLCYDLAARYTCQLLPNSACQWHFEALHMSLQVANAQYRPIVPEPLHQAQLYCRWSILLGHPGHIAPLSTRMSGQSVSPNVKEYYTHAHSIHLWKKAKGTVPIGSRWWQGQMRPTSQYNLEWDFSVWSHSRILYTFSQPHRYSHSYTIWALRPSVISKLKFNSFSSWPTTAS